MQASHPMQADFDQSTRLFVIVNAPVGQSDTHLPQFAHKCCVSGLWQ